MVALALRLVVNAVALWIAASLIDGIDLKSKFASVLFVALIFGVVNAVIKPVAKVLTLPITLLTLGLFTLVVNAGMLGLTAWLTDSLAVDGFWNAILGSIIISVVSAGLSLLITEDD